MSDDYREDESCELVVSLSSNNNRQSATHCLSKRVSQEKDHLTWLSVYAVKFSLVHQTECILKVLSLQQILLISHTMTISILLCDAYMVEVAMRVVVGPSSDARGC